MKSYVISDNLDTLVGMRLGGIHGTIAETKEEIMKEIRKAVEDKEVGIIIITEKILYMAEQEIMNIKLEKDYPLIVEIPDRHGLKEEDRLLRYIRESIGIKI